MPSTDKKNAIYLEIIDAGPALKISAICANSHEEVSFAAPKSTPRPHIERLALQKLSYVISKNQKR